MCCVVGYGNDDFPGRFDVDLDQYGFVGVRKVSDVSDLGEKKCKYKGVDG